MKLKKVEVTYQYVIVVEDDADSEDTLDIAKENALEALSDYDIHCAIVRVNDYKPGSVRDWTDRDIPYGGDGNTTTGEYLK